jgi:protein TonB
MPDYEDNEAPPSFFKKHKTAILVGVSVVTALGVAFAFLPKNAPKKKSTSSIVSISLPLPPPPPPPPPPPKERPPEPDTPQEETFQPEEAAEPEPQAAEPEPAPMGTNIEGNGPDAFGLAKGGGGGIIGGSGTGGKKGSKYGAYAAQVQSRVVQSLRSHKKTRAASLNITARIWLDASGRVTRAALSGSTGNPATDAAIRDEILTGLQFQAPPPDGMPMPIVMRLKATRPN